MPTNLTLPAMGESITEATVSRWLKAVGDTIKADEPLVEVSTDKVDTEIPAPVTGVLTQILADEDQVVRVGDVLGVIEESRPTPTPAAPAMSVPASPAPAAPAMSVPAFPAPAAPTAPVPPTTAPPQTAPPRPAAPVSPTPERAPLPWNRPAPTVPAWTPPTAPPPRPATPATPTLRAPESRPWMSLPGTPGAPASGAAGARPATWEKPWEKSPPPVFTRPPAPPPAPTPAPVIPPAPRPAPAPAPRPAPAPAPASPSPAEPADGPSYVTPLVRQVARELGVDLEDVIGTGVGGRVRKQDVVDFATQHPELAKPRVAPNAALAAPEGVDHRRGTTQTIPSPRQAWLRHASESTRTTLPLTAMAEADVTRLLDTAPGGPSVTAFVLSATAKALRTCASVNAGFDEATGVVTYHDGEHLGVTLETRDGPISPVLHDAGSTPPTAIEAWLRDATARAPLGDFAPDDLEGGTFTVIASPALVTSALVSPPQVAALGIGAPTLRPVARGDEIVPRTLVSLHLTYDTRVVDPSAAAAFLATIRGILEG